MDIKDIIKTITEKVQSDNALFDKLQKNPAKTIEELTGLNLPDEQVNSIIDAVKAKISIDKASDIAEGLGKLFKK